MMEAVPVVQANMWRVECAVKVVPKVEPTVSKLLTSLQPIGVGGGVGSQAGPTFAEPFTRPGSWLLVTV
jgi:hypothetical protein